MRFSKIFLISLIFFFPELCRADITTGLVGWWKFDEGTNGATAIDSSGKGNSGTPTGSPNYITGRIGSYAMSFNGSSYITVGDTSFPGGAVPISIAAWIYTTSSSTSGQIISWMDNISVLTNHIQWVLRFESSSNHLFFYDISSANTALYEGDSTSPIAANGWHHFVVTFDGASSSVMNFYIDGVSTSTTAFYSGDGFPAPPPVTAPTIGNATTASIDDIRIYNRVLSPADVTQLYIYPFISGPTVLSNSSIKNAKIGY